MSEKEEKQDYGEETEIAELDVEAYIEQELRRRCLEEAEKNVEARTGQNSAKEAGQNPVEKSEKSADKLGQQAETMEAGQTLVETDERSGDEKDRTHDDNEETGQNYVDEVRQESVKTDKLYDKKTELNGVEKARQSPTDEVEQDAVQNVGQDSVDELEQTVANDVVEDSVKRAEQTIEIAGNKAEDDSLVDAGQNYAQVVEAVEETSQKEEAPDGMINLTHEENTLQDDCNYKMKEKGSDAANEEELNAMKDGIKAEASKVALHSKEDLARREDHEEELERENGTREEDEEDPNCFEKQFEAGKMIDEHGKLEDGVGVNEDDDDGVFDENQSEKSLRSELNDNHSNEADLPDRGCDDSQTTNRNEELEAATVEVPPTEEAVNFESEKRAEPRSQDGSRPSSAIAGAVTVLDGSRSPHQSTSGPFCEDESDYHSVASYRYSSFESLDEGRIKKSDTSGKDAFPGNKDEKEAGRRAVLESETDRTEDEYTTCDEHSVVGADVTASYEDYDYDEIKNCVNADDVMLTFDFVKNRRSGDRLSGDYDKDEDDDDYDGYDTQEYLTADDQSESGGAGDVESTKNHGMQQSAVFGTSAEDLVSTEKAASDVFTDVEEYATADEAVKEEEDDRSTIVGSDDEQGETDVNENHVGKLLEEESVDEVGQELELKENVDITDYIGPKREIENNEELEKGTRNNEEDNAGIGDLQEAGKKVRRKKSFFSSMMAKKEAKIAERLHGYNQRYEVATEGVAEANARFKKAKSDLPLMIVEKRIPKCEELQRKNDKLEELKKRLDSYIAYNRAANNYIQNWRTMEGKVHDKKTEINQFRIKTAEKQRLLMVCKKRQSFLNSELLRQEDLQQHKNRRIQQLIDRLDMLKLRQTEQRNMVKRRIDEAKKYCELSVREAAKVVVTTKRIDTLKKKEKELEDKLFNIKKEIVKVRKMRKDKEFDVERANVQKSVKAMKKERGW